MHLMYCALIYPLYAGASLHAGGFSVDKQFGLRIMVVDRTIEAGPGGYCSTRHSMRFEPSASETIGTL